jgi:hypothetical protein
MLHRRAFDFDQLLILSVRIGLTSFGSFSPPCAEVVEMQRGVEKQEECALRLMPPHQIGHDSDLLYENGQEFAPAPCIFKNQQARHKTTQQRIMHPDASCRHGDCDLSVKPESSVNLKIDADDWK